MLYEIFMQTFTSSLNLLSFHLLLLYWNIYLCFFYSFVLSCFHPHSVNVDLHTILFAISYDNPQNYVQKVMNGARKLINTAHKTGTDTADWMRLLLNILLILRDSTYWMHNEDDVEEIQIILKAWW